MKLSKTELAQLRQSGDYKDIEKRFKAFCEELGKLSSAYGIGIQSTGGLFYYYQNEQIVYDQDFTSGDLEFKEVQKPVRIAKKAKGENLGRRTLLGRGRRGR